MKITSTRSEVTYTLTLSEREMLCLQSAITVADLKEASDFLVRQGHPPTWQMDDGDDGHYQLYMQVSDFMDGGNRFQINETIKSRND